MRWSVRNRHVFGADAVIMALLPVLEYVLRFEGWHWSPADSLTFRNYLVASVPLKLGIFLALGLYTRLWTEAGFRDFLRVIAASAVSALVCTVTFALILPGIGISPLRVPLSALALDAVATMVVAGGTRAGARLLAQAPVARYAGADPKPTLIAGAGAAGRAIAEELHAHPEWGLTLAGFVDDDPARQHRLLAGVEVLGPLAAVPALLATRGVRELIIAMPRASGPVIRQLVRAASTAGVHTRTVPSLFELISERVSVTALRKVEIADLLRREPVQTDLAAVRNAVAGRIVLVTGAGGSIGSELCRQIAPLGPARLILLGHGENSIFEIHAALAAAHPALPLLPVIADVRDRQHILQLFGQHLPQVVFHAAAHKHVPLMEGNVAEAILNNVAGTDSVVEASVMFGVEQFVLISSDKAVRPCSIMGATKRIAEMLVQHAGAALHRKFVVVRLGNVLGSRGSVVPTFLRQIEAGGPVCITHPDMQRYFMTIPEAVQLVLQAGAQGSDGQVFVLDMGKPVRIVDLATDLIRLSGLEPDGDIEIRFTGPRPGERLFEEILFSGETVEPTAHPKVLRATNVHLPDRLRPRVRRLEDAARDRQSEQTLRLLIEELAPECHVTPLLVVPGPRAPQHGGGPVGAQRLASAGPDAGA